MIKKILSVALLVTLFFMFGCTKPVVTPEAIEPSEAPVIYPAVMSITGSITEIAITTADSEDSVNTIIRMTYEAGLEAEFMVNPATFLITATELSVGSRITFWYDATLPKRYSTRPGTQRLQCSRERCPVATASRSTALTRTSSAPIICSV